MEEDLSVLPKASSGPELDDKSFTLGGVRRRALRTLSGSCSLDEHALLLKCIHDL